MDNHWQPGENIVLRGICAGRVWLVQSVSVVKDERDETILLLLPGGQCAYPEGYFHWKRGDSSLGNRWQYAGRKDWKLRQFPWQTNRILMFLEPDKYYSCWMFWDHTSSQFTGYYVNFQLPYQRSRLGFDTLDLDLDLVIDPQMHWHWKDENEYREGIREGGIQAEWVQAIEASLPEVFERIAHRTPPLDGSWINWRPDPSWNPPHLPDQWMVV
jgi:hypothetical protein